MHLSNNSQSNFQVVPEISQQNNLIESIMPIFSPTQKPLDEYSNNNLKNFDACFQQQINPISSHYRNICF